MNVLFERDQSSSMSKALLLIARRRLGTNLDLVDVDVLILLLHLLVSNLHRTDCCHLSKSRRAKHRIHRLILWGTHGVLQVLRRHLSLLHIVCLLRELS